MKSVSEYNRQLNQERKEDRRVCMDLQTYTVQYPVGLGKDNKGLRRWTKRRRRISSIWRSGRRYPVALLPTQYQDWFLRYSAQELKYFPLNTVIHEPIIGDFDKLPSLLQVSNTNNSDSDVECSDVLSDLDDDSTCSCGEEHCGATTKNSNFEQNSNQSNLNNNQVQDFNENTCPPKFFPSIGASLPNDTQSNESMININPLNGDDEQRRVCKVCNQTISSEDLLKCADCGTMSHPKCLEFSGELLDAIRLYNWQCMDCKSCNRCGQPHDEEQMMFCDKCDRGYHTYCAGLSSIPEGHWVCALCAICASCGTKKPSENASVTQWQHNLIKIFSPDGQTLTRHQVFCETCYQLRKI